MSYSPPLRGAPIGFFVGWMLIILGISLLLPFFLSILAGKNTDPFFFTCFLSVFSGGLLVFTFSHQRIPHLQPADGFILTIAAWISISFFAALPFYFSGSSASLMDALFESVSALTTTGLSLFSEQYRCHEGLCFWRVFLQWFGGFGIILMAITLLPALRIGGTQLVLSEFSDRSEKIMPRASQVASLLMGLYGALTGLGAVLLMLDALSLQDALYYSMASISTGGIVVASHPLHLMSPYGKLILTLIMGLGGSTLIVLISVLKGHRKRIVYDAQMRGYAKLLAVISVLTVLWRGDSPIDSLFMAVSAVTTTGFALGAPYDGFCSTLFLMASFIGGCSGSTSGGIKVFRLQMLLGITKNQIFRVLRPYGVFLTFYNEKLVDESATTNLVTIIFFYMMGWLLVTFGLSCLGHGLLESFPLAASLITNSGLYLGTLVHHLDTLSTASKALSILAMLCGRFEFMTLLAVLMMPFLRR
jgi:trk system potassium uptake protein TrkH